MTMVFWVGPSEALDTTLAAIGKLSPVVEDELSSVWGRRRHVLGDCWSKTERRFEVKPLEQFFGSLLSSAGLESCAPVHTLGVRSEMKSSGGGIAAWSCRA